MKTMDKKYRDELLLTLRLHEISGKRVGEVLAEVESHVAETGEDPAEAFGTPREYAARVAAELDSSTGKLSTLEKVGGGLSTGILAYFGSQFALDGLFPDSDAPPAGVPFTLADAVASVSLLLLVIAGIFLLFRAVTALAHRRVYGVAGVVLLAAGLASAGLARWLVGDGPMLFVLPRWVGVGVGVLSLAAAAVLVIRASKRGRVVDPR